MYISIHALRKESDAAAAAAEADKAISIHALRKESDPSLFSGRRPPYHFYPRSPQGERP